MLKDSCAVWAQNEYNMTQRTQNFVTELNCRWLYWNVNLCTREMWRIALVISEKHLDRVPEITSGQTMSMKVFS